MSAKGGCGGCIGLVILGCIAFVGVALIGLYQQQKRGDAPVANEPSAFERVGDSFDLDGNYMQLFVAIGEFDDSQLKALVAKHRSGKGKMMEAIVVFDDRSACKFPSNPYTAHFGIEEEPLKHIIAVWENLGGNESLARFEPNEWTGKRRSIK